MRFTSLEVNGLSLKISWLIIRIERLAAAICVMDAITVRCLYPLCSILPESNHEK